MFIGYPQGKKGYRIFDLTDKKGIVSRDVKFVENVFAFSDNIERNNSEARLDDFLGNTVAESDELTRRKAGQGLLNKPDLDPGTHDENETTIDPNICEDPADHVTENTTDQMKPIVEQRDKRSRSRPKYLDDLIVDLPYSVAHASPTGNQQPSTVHPMINFLSYDRFSDSHKAFLTSVSLNYEQKHFNQAVQDVKWREAMQKEINSLEENGTWSLEELPKGKRAIDSKWVYKIKYQPNGKIERYKAELVSKGFM
uniref:Retroviral polymerase SH3-like domain-containing protein n=1 Tax=Lactuca sativa TaxID=4236 RepID=A0A9R1XLC5_LACSA|nr:hypothetical protein LSAT_V11C300103400 [Lactuca sativa]